MKNDTIQKIEKRFQRRGRPNNTTVLFVPKSENSRLIETLQETENSIGSDLGWGTKLIEKPGKPLLTLFQRKYKMKDGCERGKDCPMCEGTGLKCTTKRAVYQATCKLCKADHKIPRGTGVYVGETSRHVGTRLQEHLKNLHNWKKESFILEHWALQHGTLTVPPEFEYKIIASHKDALSRQLHEAVLISNKGNLNRKNEFASNQLIRLQSKDYSWEEEKHGRTHRRLEQELNEKIDGFVNVMKNVLKKKNKRKSPSNDSDLHCYRFQTRAIALVSTEESSKSKRIRMETSTPLGYRNRNLIQIDSSPVDRLGTEDMNLGNTLDSSQEGSTPQPGICLLEKNLECLEVTPPEAETEALSTAKNIITANSFMDSSDAYRNRMNSLPSRLSAVIAPQSGTGGRNRSASMGDIDMDISEWNSDDFTREFGGTGRIYNEFWSEGDDYLVDIPYLFRDQEVISREQMEQ